MYRSRKTDSLSKSEAYVKATAFCAYQERSRQEVREKLYSYQLEDDVVEELMERLEKENFLNEERFAKAFAGGKFRLKKWGRLKIRQELKMRGITEPLIRKALQEIDEEAYIQSLHELLEKKNRLERSINLLEQKQKLLRFALSKGYEQDLIWGEINGLIA